MEHQPATRKDYALLALARALRNTDYTFTTVTPLTQARVNARPENAWARDLAGVFGWSRPFKTGFVSEKLLTLMEEADVLIHCEGGLLSSVRFSSLGRQLFVHSAYPTSAPDSVFFGPDTVRFSGAIRSHLDAHSASVSRAADVGCGAGAGAIAFAATASTADVLMLDINAAALRFARLNAELNETPNARVCRSDVLKDTSGTFDFIMSNPPYLIDPAGRVYRNGGGNLGEGLTLRILRESITRLSPGGSLLLYTGSAIVAGRDQLKEACSDSLDSLPYHWTYDEMDPDIFGEELETLAYARADRIAAVVLTVTNKGSS
jgi:methylase of polypeptide subunit release factors